MGDTNVKVKVHSQNTYPIRMLSHQWHQVRSLTFGRFTYLTPAQNELDIATSMSLSNTFSGSSNTYLSPSLSEKLDKTHRQNYSYSDERANPHYKALFDKHFSETLKIINAFGAEFQDWSDYYDLETEALKAQALGELPDLSLEDYNPSITSCEIVATILNKERHIHLLVNPRKLFNALVTAENTGAALEYIAPKQPTALGQIRLFAPHPGAQRKPEIKAIK